jgi:hypothetical protein
VGSHLRVIPTTAIPRLAAHVRLWMGDSRGHWEGHTLVSMLRMTPRRRGPIRRPTSTPTRSTWSSGSLWLIGTRCTSKSPSTIRAYAPGHGRGLFRYAAIADPTFACWKSAMKANGIRTLETLSATPSPPV